MQELIEKSKVMALARQLETHLVWYTPTELEPREFIKMVGYLSTTVHHEEKVGETYEFYDDWDWVKWKLLWFLKDWDSSYAYLSIRPIQEHPDIKILPENSLLVIDFN